MNKLGPSLVVNGVRRTGNIVRPEAIRASDLDAQELLLFASSLQSHPTRKPLTDGWRQPLVTLAPVRNAESTEDAKLRQQATTRQLGEQLRYQIHRDPSQSPLTSPHFLVGESYNAFSDSESDHGSSRTSSPVQGASMQRFGPHQPVFFRRTNAYEPPSPTSGQSSPIGSPLSSDTSYDSREDSPANAARIHPEPSCRSAVSPVSRRNSRASTHDSTFDAYPRSEISREHRLQGHMSVSRFQYPRLSVDAVSPIFGVSPTSQDRIALHKKALETTAIIARSTARLMSRTTPVFDLPNEWDSGNPPRLALFESVQTLIAETKKLPTPPELNQAQKSHLTCVENFEKCLVRYKGGSGSDVAFLTLMRSTLGHLDQILDTHVTGGLEINKATLADSESWTVYDVLKTKKIDTPLAIRPASTSGQTAMHAILYGGKQEERVSPLSDTLDEERVSPLSDTLDSVPDRFTPDPKSFRIISQDEFDIDAHQSPTPLLPRVESPLDLPAAPSLSKPQFADECGIDADKSPTHLLPPVESPLYLPAAPSLSKPQFEHVCVIRFSADSFDDSAGSSSETLVNVLSVIDTIDDIPAPMPQWIHRVNDKLPLGQTKLAPESPQWEAALKVVLPDESEDEKREHYRQLFFGRCKVKTEL